MKPVKFTDALCVLNTETSSITIDGLYIRINYSSGYSQIQLPSIGTLEQQLDYLYTLWLESFKEI